MRRLEGDASFMPHYFLIQQVQKHQQMLLKAGYKCVVFTEADEMIVANSTRHQNGGLGEYLRKFAYASSYIYVRPVGVTISHEMIGQRAEAAMDWSKDVLSQRNWWAPSPMFSKPLITKVPLKYIPGFHKARPFQSNLTRVGQGATAAFFATTVGARSSRQKPKRGSSLPRIADGPEIALADGDLVMVHLHGADVDYCMQREELKARSASASMHAMEKKQRLGAHFVNFERIKENGLMCTSKLETRIPVEAIPKEWKVWPL